VPGDSEKVAELADEDFGLLFVNAVVSEKRRDARAPLVDSGVRMGPNQITEYARMSPKSLVNQPGRGQTFG
jgi:hypothetical protein